MTKTESAQLQRAIEYYGEVNGPRIAARWRTEVTKPELDSALELAERLRFLARWPTVEHAEPATLTQAADEIERLTRLLAMRPPYYCHQCRCASCGNTFERGSLERGAT